jgi:hypothetical protein
MLMSKDMEGCFHGLYVCIRVGHKAGPCTATFNDLLCFTFMAYLKALSGIRPKRLSRPTKYLISPE